MCYYYKKYLKFLLGRWYLAGTRRELVRVKMRYPHLSRC